jgi:hypothetical protein
VVGGRWYPFKCGQRVVRGTCRDTNRIHRSEKIYDPISMLSQLIFLGRHARPKAKGSSILLTKTIAAVALSRKARHACRKGCHSRQNSACESFCYSKQCHPPCAPRRLANILLVIICYVYAKCKMQSLVLNGSD